MPVENVLSLFIENDRLHLLHILSQDHDGVSYVILIEYPCIPFVAFADGGIDVTLSRSCKKSPGDCEGPGASSTDKSRRSINAFVDGTTVFLCPLERGKAIGEVDVDAAFTSVAIPIVTSSDLLAL